MRLRLSHQLTSRYSQRTSVGLGACITSGFLRRGNRLLSRRDTEGDAGNEGARSLRESRAASPSIATPSGGDAGGDTGGAAAATAAPTAHESTSVSRAELELTSTVLRGRQSRPLFAASTTRLAAAASRKVTKTTGSMRGESRMAAISHVTRSISSSQAASVRGPLQSSRSASHSRHRPYLERGSATDKLPILSFAGACGAVE